MKKGFITTFLFVSLFFFYSNGVKADTYNFELDSTNFDLINEDFFLARELAIEFVNNPDNEYDTYIIFYSLSKDKYVIYFTSSTFFNSFYINVYDTYITMKYFKAGGTPRYELNNKELSYISNSAIFESNVTINDNKLYNFFYLDTNLNRYTNSDKFNFESITLSYSNYSETFTRFPPTLYSIYLAAGGGVIEDKHHEEKQVLSNFYILVIEKIVLLSNYFVSNYIYLSFIGIVILIFIIELIRRYLL